MSLVVMQTPFQDVMFVENPEPRCPVVLLLDTSASMSGSPINELNAGVAQFRDELLDDELTRKRVEVSVITFGPVRVASDFTGADAFEPPTSVASGDTPIGGAIAEGLRLLRARKDAYRANGIAYFRPWVFLITDGAPNRRMETRCRRHSARRRRQPFMFFAVAVQRADLNTLRQLSVREPLHLRGLQFREFFQWLSQSLSSVSRSTPGDLVPLDNPTAPDGWAASGELLALRIGVGRRRLAQHVRCTLPGRQRLPPVHDDCR